MTTEVEAILRALMREVGTIEDAARQLQTVADERLRYIERLEAEVKLLRDELRELRRKT